MEIQLEETFTPEEYLDFRAGTGWPIIKLERVKDLIEHSAFRVRAKMDGKTVGIARVLFDYGYTAYISDVIVKPEFQGKGVGMLMVEHLISKIKQSVDPDDYLKFVLVAAPGKSGFYEKLGFSIRNEENGWGMCMNLKRADN